MPAALSRYWNTCETAAVAVIFAIISRKSRAISPKPLLLLPTNASMPSPIAPVSASNAWPPVVNRSCARTEALAAFSKPAELREGCEHDLRDLRREVLDVVHFRYGPPGHGRCSDPCRSPGARAACRHRAFPSIRRRHILKLLRSIAPFVQFYDLVGARVFRLGMPALATTATMSSTCCCTRTWREVIDELAPPQWCRGLLRSGEQRCSASDLPMVSSSCRRRRRHRRPLPVQGVVLRAVFRVVAWLFSLLLRTFVGVICAAAPPTSL